MTTPVTTSREPTVRLDLLRSMLLIRRVEEHMQRLYGQGLVQGPTHLCIGHEAISVGAAAALTPDDQSLGTYRGHGHVLARGAPPELVITEMLGRTSGLCQGKGGSMHLTSVDHGFYGSYAIVGSHLPIANGLAWAAKLQGSQRVVACFFGDGATNIGAFHEAVNLAAVWDLPVVFVCENNHYMEYTPIGDVTPVQHPAADRAAAYGLEGHVVDGNDVEAVREVMSTAVAQARRGRPSIVEATTYRTCGHAAADPGTSYRTAEEIEEWRGRDPITAYRAVLRSRGADETTLDDLDAEVTAEVEDAVERAKDAPVPDLGAAHTHVWASEDTSWRN